VNAHANTIDRYYALLDELSDRIGGPKVLADPMLSRSCPMAGLYVFFEPGQTRPNGRPRVVRVGTHALRSRSRTTLWQRLAQHRGYLGGPNPGGGSHRGSIFRQHVGSALAGQHGDTDLLRSWLASRPLPGFEDAERHLELEVSSVIRSMPFLWLSVPTSENGSSDRGMLEENSISLLSTLASGEQADTSCWLGRHASSPKVRESSLWNVNHVTASTDDAFLGVIEEHVERT
jgi:hypothetical protein